MLAIVLLWKAESGGKIFQEAQFCLSFIPLNDKNEIRCYVSINFFLDT